MSAKKGSKHTAPKKAKAKGSSFFSKLKAGFAAMTAGKKALVITCVSIILVVTVLIGVVLGIVGDLTKDYNHMEIDDPEIEEIVPIDKQILNIALFGIDSRAQGFKGLSDSIMILSANKATGDIKLISVMRDSLVALPEYKGKTYRPNKINSAYSKGGPIYAIKVLNQNFGLDIKEYATVNFYGMAEIIDAVGGLEIDVLQRELRSESGLNTSIHNQAKELGIKDPPYVTEAGTQLLSGIQAVAWARIRGVSNEQGTANDYGRTDRQRVVMEKLLNKALSMSKSKYPDLIKAMLPHMETSLDFNEILSLATNVLGKQVKFEQTRVPQTNYVISDNYCNYYAGAALYYDTAYASKIIHALIYDGISQEDYIEQNGIEKNKWYRELVAGAPSNTGSGSSGSNSTSSGSSSSTSSTQSSSDSSSSETTDATQQPSDETQGQGDQTTNDTTTQDTTTENNTTEDNTTEDTTQQDGTGDGSEENNTQTETTGETE